MFKAPSTGITNLQYLMYYLTSPDPEHKIWRVWSCTFKHGSGRDFWFKRLALFHASFQKEPFVYVENLLTGERIDIRDNPDNEKPPSWESYVRD